MRLCVAFKFRLTITGYTINLVWWSDKSHGRSQYVEVIGFTWLQQYLVDSELVKNLVVRLHLLSPPLIHATTRLLICKPSRVCVGGQYLAGGKIQLPVFNYVSFIFYHPRRLIILRI